MIKWQKLKRLIKRRKSPEEIEREEYFSGKTKCAMCKTPTPYRVKHRLQSSLARHRLHSTTAVLCAKCHRQMHMDKVRAELNAEHMRFLESIKPPEPFIFR